MSRPLSEIQQRVTSVRRYLVSNISNLVFPISQLNRAYFCKPFTAPPIFSKYHRSKLDNP
jgi:hypothetical protein